MPGFQPTRVQQLALIGLALAVLFAVSVRQTRPPEAAPPAPQTAPAPGPSPVEAALGAIPLGVPAPPVQLLNRAGAAVPLASYRGRVVFLNFWATWCGPCRAEMASLVSLSGTLDPADIAFVSMAEDDTWPPVDAYLRATPLPFDVFRDDPPRIENQFDTTAYPTSFLIDRDGRLRYRFNGARDWDTAEARALLGELGVQERR